MKTKKFLFNFVGFVLAMSFFLTACETSPQTRSGLMPQQAIAAGSAAYWTGDGGRGASIAVFNMTSPGLSPDEQHIPLLLRGALAEALNRYSAMDVGEVRQDDSIQWCSPAELTFFDYYHVNGQMSGTYTFFRPSSFWTHPRTWVHSP